LPNPLLGSDGMFWCAGFCDVSLTCWFRELGLKTSEEEYEGDLDRIKTFRDWAAAEVIGDSDTVLVLPYRVSEPAYRQDEHRHDGHCCSTSGSC
jgi:hypothetical protein